MSMWRPIPGTCASLSPMCPPMSGRRRSRLRIGMTTNKRVRRVTRTRVRSQRRKRIPIILSAEVTMESVLQMRGKLNPQVRSILQVPSYPRPEESIPQAVPAQRPQSPPEHQQRPQLPPKTPSKGRPQKGSDEAKEQMRRVRFAQTMRYLSDNAVQEHAQR